LEGLEAASRPRRRDRGHIPIKQFPLLGGGWRLLVFRTKTTLQNIPSVSSQKGVKWRWDRYIWRFSTTVTNSMGNNAMYAHAEFDVGQVHRWVGLDWVGWVEFLKFWMSWVRLRCIGALTKYWLWPLTTMNCCWSTKLFLFRFTLSWVFLMKVFDQQLLLGWVHTSYIIGCVGLGSWFSGLSWIRWMKNGPKSNSGPVVTKDH